MDRRSFLKMATGTAAALAFPFEAFATTGGDGSFLDLAEAVRFRNQHPPKLDYGVGDFTAYTRATPEALEFLANQGWDHVFIGLAELDKNNARILARWDAAFSFTNLENLDTEVAAILSDGTGIRSFHRLIVVSPELARELAKTGSILDIRMDSISFDVANELARHPHELSLHSKIPPSEQVMHVLCSHAGYRLTIGGWDYQPDNALDSFVSPNADKTVSFYQYQAESGKWIDSVNIEEDINRWSTKK